MLGRFVSMPSGLGPYFFAPSLPNQYRFVFFKERIFSSSEEKKKEEADTTGFVCYKGSRTYRGQPGSLPQVQLAVTGYQGFLPVN